ncbi:enoyl-CoA hydratase/isomerase family protein [Streptomyces echinatus]|uniref:enoyl-CoA hydratase/isomerase family protein n=1 Tax=Streptomyces echinatus TaxID=67293 RepID=UPI0031EDB18D
MPLSVWEHDPAPWKPSYQRGAGERGLCAGGDIRAVHDGRPGRATQPGLRAFWRDELPPQRPHRVARDPKAYVAVMDGIVMGDGVRRLPRGGRGTGSVRSSTGSGNHGSRHGSPIQRVSCFCPRHRQAKRPSQLAPGPPATLVCHHTPCSARGAHTDGCAALHALAVRARADPTCRPPTLDHAFLPGTIRRKTPATGRPRYALRTDRPRPPVGDCAEQARVDRTALLRY